jgi:hypothetical protein
MQKQDVMLNLPCDALGIQYEPRGKLAELDAPRCATRLLA